MRGVCSAVSNARHQLTGIQIWTPDGQSIQTEEPAPDDLFALPLRPLASLRRFNTESALNQRIRTSGTVVLHVPGHYLYVQDGMDSVFALSQQPDALQPGRPGGGGGFPRQGRPKICPPRSGLSPPRRRQRAKTGVIVSGELRRCEFGGASGENRGGFAEQDGKGRRNAFAHPDQGFHLRGQPEFSRS